MRSLMGDRYLKKFRRHIHHGNQSGFKGSVRKKPPDPEKSMNTEPLNTEDSIKPQKQSTSPVVTTAGEDER